MHVLLIRLHRNWKLAKSLIGNDLAPTEDRSRQQAAPGGTAAICWPPQTQISRYQIDIQPQILGSIEHFLILLSTKGAVLSCNLYILYQVKRYKIKGSRIQSPHCTAVLYIVLYSIYDIISSAPDLVLSLYQQSYLCREEAQSIVTQTHFIF